MSYESVKLALSPVAWYRNDEVAGTEMTDSSGNGHHRQYENLDNTVVLGQPSGVETVPESFSVYGERQVSSIAVTLSGPFDSRIAFTWEALVRPTADGPAVIISRHGPFLNALSMVGGGNRNFRFELQVGGSEFQIDSNVAALLGSWYHLVAVRNASSMFLMVNGAMAALRNDLPAATPIDVDSPDVIRLCGPSVSFFGNSEEFTFYDHALTPAQATAVYEEIVAALNMQGRADIRFSAVLDGSVEPDPVAYPFRHNWSEPVIERLRWKTERFDPVDGIADTVRHRSGLRRQVEYSHLLMDERLRRQFEARSFGGRKALIQFEPDKVQVPLLSGATSAAFDTRYRDFEVGQYALIYESDTKHVHRLLTSVDDSGIEWDDPLTTDYNGFIKPARSARLLPQQTIELHTDTIGEASVIYDYLLQDEPLSPRRIIPWTPTLTYEDGEVFDLAVWRGHDWSELPEIEFTAARDVLDNGIGIVSDKQYPSGAGVVSPYRLLLDTRESIARYLGWLYARAGQYTAFWMPTFRQDLEPLSNIGGLTVSGHEYTELYADSSSRQHVAFVYFDNTYVLRQITGAMAVGGNDLLTLNGAVPTFANLRWLSFLRRVTLASDDLELAWNTDSVVVATFAVRDAPSGAEMASASPSPSRSPSPSASVSSSVSPSLSPSASLSASVSPSRSPSASLSPSASSSRSPSPSASLSPSGSLSPSSSVSQSPSSSPSPSV